MTPGNFSRYGRTSVPPGCWRHSWRSRHRRRMGALDRVLGYRHPDGRASERGVRRNGRRHPLAPGNGLSPVPGRRRCTPPFRFGSRSTAHQSEAWDPFARAEPATRRLAPSSGSPRRSTDVVVPGAAVHPAFPATVLLAGGARGRGGPRRWNRQQGFYVYLRDRLIQSGGWSRLRAEDEHTKLARVAIDIPPGAEELFGINVSKMRVSLPESVRPLLRALASGVAARARDAYDVRARSTLSPEDICGQPDDDYLVVTDDILTVEHVATVLISELEHYPDLLRRILSRLGLDILDEQPIGTEVVSTSAQVEPAVVERDDPRWRAALRHHFSRYPDMFPAGAGCPPRGARSLHARETRRLERIADAVARGYGTPDLGNKLDPVDELVYIILARRTRENAYQQAYDAITDRWRSGTRRGCPRRGDCVDDPGEWSRRTKGAQHQRCASGVRDRFRHLPPSTWTTGTTPGSSNSSCACRKWGRRAPTASWRCR